MIIRGKIAFAALFALVFLNGCGGEAEKPKPSSNPLMLKRFEPTTVKAGEDFNKQPPSGVSALWAETENATPDTVLVLNETELDSTVQSDGRLVTAPVPKNLYETAGEFSIYLRDKKTNEKSNELKFKVTP